MLRTCVLVALASPFGLQAQDQWPLPIGTEQGVLTIYQPQPESYKGTRLSSRAAISFRATGIDTEPVFGAIWTECELDVDRETRIATIRSEEVKRVRFPSIADSSRAEELKALVRTEVPRLVAPFSIDRLIASLEEIPGSTDEFSTSPPEIIYRDRPSTLVFIDGDPIFKKDEKLGYERVLNTPFLIARKKEGAALYLGSETYWYEAESIVGPWTLTEDVPRELKEALSTEGEGADEAGPGAPPELVVRTAPAELLQTTGKAEMKTLEGTGLLYVSNSPNDLFMAIEDQQYYALLSGRWYRTPDLSNGTWTYVPADKLPGDFAKITEGAEKDHVLASVAGTNAARDAVLDAQVPQTAKVDRNTTLNVEFDGEPSFVDVKGTDVAYAENSSTTVLRIGKRYHALDNGIWFDGPSPQGPWTVSTETPDGLENIPPESPVYNVKYVEVYESTPEVVYVGYTPGYTGSYVYGPTVIYGTGYYYSPWYGTYYYPRPVTYGFSMHYNPWTGWSMGFSMSVGWFTFGVGGYPHYGGWWGPPMYRPPYYRPPYGGGYYGRPVRYGKNTVNIDNSTNINIGQGGRDRSGNLYDRQRPGVEPSRPAQRPAGKVPSDVPRTQGKPTGRPATGKVPEHVYTDKKGDVYQRTNDSWKRYDTGGKWQDAGKAPSMANKPSTGSSDRTAPGNRPGTTGGAGGMDRMQQMERQHQNSMRGQQRVNGFQQQQRSMPARPPMGGGGGRTAPRGRR
ncbi:MAG: hypothetical protein KDB88_06475 [Flavobacteriales bacterium]|nr:hypothetical protein [Flavobacteriales bacterium]